MARVFPGLVVETFPNRFWWEGALKAWSFTVLGVLLLTLPRLAGQEHWPQFRGPNAGVIPDNPALPETWNATREEIDASF